MLFIIDSNEFVFALSPHEETTKTLLDNLLAKTSRHSIPISRTVFKEVKHNLSPEAFREFILLLVSADPLMKTEQMPWLPKTGIFSPTSPTCHLKFLTLKPA